MAVKHGLYRNFPHIICIKRVAHVVVCVSIAPANVMGILGKNRTAETELVHTAIRNFVQRVPVSVVCLEYALSPASESMLEGSDQAVVIRNTDKGQLRHLAERRIRARRNRRAGA